ncbi:DUF6401 family natural product biosynthesis protein [Kitasatospora sp. NPDC059463]|uniref:DUF6401 family natural product biosynthesis protein n=1 Tax=unclassified Kitasatospora TaxID=2633591 RepID=UPI003686C21A
MPVTPDESHRGSPDDSPDPRNRPAGCPLPGIVAAFTPRLAEFAFEPGFTAAVDQHAAELRELLYAQGPELLPRPLDREELSDYALGFLDALTEIGWREPVGYDYAVHRLTAICWLVRQDGLLAA